MSAATLAPTVADSRPILVRLALLVRPWWSLLGLTLLGALAGQACLIGIAATSALLVARVARGGTPADVTPYLVALAALVLGRAVLAWLEQWLAHRVTYGMLAWLRSRSYTAIEPLAPAYTLRRRTGDVTSVVMSDVETIEVFFAHTLIPLVVMLIVPTVVLIVLATIAPLLAAVLLPFLLAVAFLPLVMRRWGERLAPALRQTQGLVNAHMTDSVQGLRELVSFGRGPARTAEIKALSDELGRVQLRYSAFVGAQAGLTEPLVMLGGLAVLLSGASLVAAGAIDRYDLPLVLLLAWAAFRPVIDVAGVARSLHQVAAAAQRYFDIVDEPVLVVEHTTHGRGALPPALEFADVTFRYHPDSPPVLEHVSYAVQPGETVALVGASGAGKSTCTSLLLRFWDVEAGEIRLGGTPLQDFPLDDLRRRIAVVQQDNYLFNTTIRENLMLGRPEATDAEVEAAAREANIHDFIAGLPQGYDTVIGERGVKLSGGQRQRIAIARALLKDAPILILDEATSNLDSENEQLIRAAIARLMQGRTTLVIAHRLSSIAAADRVVMLEGGQVVASGRHADLVGADGAYSRLLASQRRAAPAAPSAVGDG